MKPALAIALLALTLPDIAPNPRHRSGLDLAPGQEQTAIAMRAEVVELVLHEDHAAVRAVFDLEHTGQTPEQLEVGFPTEAVPIARSVRDGLHYANPFLEPGGTIYAFTAEVDGAAVEHQRKQVEDDDPRQVHRRWVCWPMRFAPGQRRRVEVRYEVETRDAMYLEPHSALQPRELIYVLQTGRGWQGPIGSARILLRAAEGFDLDRVDGTTPPPTARRDGEWEWHFTDFEPDQDIHIRYRVYRDPAHAVDRVRAALQERPDDAELVLDLAENLAALDQHAEAAALYARLGDWGEGRRSRRLPKAVFKRLYYRPAAYLAAHSYGAAGEHAPSREWAVRADYLLDQRIADLRDDLDRGSGSRREAAAARLPALEAMRDELRRLLR